MVHLLKSGHFFLIFELSLHLKIFITCIHFILNVLLVCMFVHYIHHNRNCIKSNKSLKFHEEYICKYLGNQIIFYMDL